MRNNTPTKSKVAHLTVYEDFTTPDLASSSDPLHGTPSKETNLLSALTSTGDVNSNTDLLVTSTKRAPVHEFTVPHRASGVLNTDESIAKSSLHGPLTYQWASETGKPCKVALSETIHLRLRSSFKLPSTTFHRTVKSYLKRKFVEAEYYSYLYTAPVSFYVMAKELFGVSHELFSDAVNCSGILSHFCSIDGEDSVFGSSGSWEDVENEVHGGAGFPPFHRKTVSEVIQCCEKNVRRKKPYFRLYLLPLHEKSPLRVMASSEKFYGEIIARFRPGCLGFRRQIDVLQEEMHCSQEEWSPLVETALVIWVNEPYRILHPVPKDLEDCLVIFIDELVGEASGLDFSALWRAFPRQYRKGNEKADDLENLSHPNQ